MFGAAVLFSLVIALLIPYIWMRQLTKKVLLDTNRAQAESVLLRAHFRLKPSGEMALPVLNDRGEAKDPNEPGIVWVALHKEQKGDLSLLNDVQRRLLETLRRDEALELSKVDGVLHSDYVKQFRATEGCVSGHTPPGSGGGGLLPE